MFTIIEYIEKCPECDSPLKCVACGFDEQFIKLPMLDERFVFVHKYQRVKCPRCLSVYDSCSSCDYNREDKNTFKWKIIERKQKETFTCKKCSDENKKYKREEISIIDLAQGSTVIIPMFYHQLCDAHAMEFILKYDDKEELYEQLQTSSYKYLSKEIRTQVKTLKI